MKILVKPTSNICGDGFDITALINDIVIFENHYHYGYNVSYSKRFADEQCPYVTDILKDICRRENLKLTDIEVVDGYNSFNGKIISKEKFYEKYLKES